MHMSRLLLLAGFLFLFGCKKGVEESATNKSSSEMATKITTWLDVYIQASSPKKGAVIKSLGEHLDLPSLSIEPYKDGERLVVVPIKPGLELNSPKEPLSNYLVATLGEDGEIKKGNIIQYLPKETSITELPKNTISKIFTHNDLECNGQFAVLSLSGEFRFRLCFTKGKLSAVAEPRKEDKRKNEKTLSCTNWYLVTIYFYEDGIIWNTTREFLFQTCDGVGEGGCPPDYLCHSPDDGGGSNSEDMDYEYAISRPVSWSAYTTKDGGSTVYSHEQLNGTRSTSGVAKFTSINYHTDNVQTLPTYDPKYTVWHKYYWTPALSQDGKTGTSTLSGKLTYPNHQNPADSEAFTRPHNWVADTDL